MVSTSSASPFWVLSTALWYHEVKSERETSASSASPFWVLISDVHCFVVSRSSGDRRRAPKRTKQLSGVDLKNRIRLRREFPVSKLAKRSTASLCVRVRVRVCARSYVRVGAGGQPAAGGGGQEHRHRELMYYLILYIYIYIYCFRRWWATGWKRRWTRAQTSRAYV